MNLGAARGRGSGRPERWALPPRPPAWVLPALVGTVTLVTFLPNLRNGFVNWDDVRMFVENPRYRGLGPAQLRWAWTTMRLGEWMPLTWMSYGADYALWGLAPFGYHLTNLLLHVGTVFAVYGLAVSLLDAAVPPDGPTTRTGNRMGAALAALAFGVHPLRAEPVAWVSARGTVLGALFLVLATHVYVAGWARAAGGRIRRPWLWGSVGLYGLSLLARSTGLVLPAVLLVLDIYPLRRVDQSRARWAVCVEKVPFVILSLATVPLAFMARVGSVEAVASDPYDPVAAVAATVFSAAFYLRKTIVVGSLAPIYEMPTRDRLLLESVLASGAALVLITALMLALRRRWPAGLAAWVAYLALLLPMSGMVPSGHLIGVVDRYSYASCVPWAVLAGAGVASAWRRWWRGRLTSPVVAGTAALGVLVLVGWGVLSWRQVQVWRDGSTLWRHTVGVAPRSWLAQNQLGAALEQAGDLPGALAAYRRAAEILGDHPGLLSNTGRVLAAQGRLSEAREHFRRAIRARPTFADAYLGLGAVLAADGDPGAAIEQYETAVRLDPNSAAGHYHLGVALASQGRLPEAILHYRRALELKPDFVEAQASLKRAGVP